MMSFDPTYLLMLAGIATAHLLMVVLVRRIAWRKELERMGLNRRRH